MKPSLAAVGQCCDHTPTPTRCGAVVALPTPNRELLRLQLSGHGTGINTATVLRGAMQLTHGAAAGQAAARFSTALPPAGRQQLMQQLMQRQRAHVQSVSSRWASVEAKVVALVNSCMLAPAGQVRQGGRGGVMVLQEQVWGGGDCVVYMRGQPVLASQPSSGAADAGRMQAQHCWFSPLSSSSSSSELTHHLSWPGKWPLAAGKLPAATHCSKPFSSEGPPARLGLVCICRHCLLAPYNTALGAACTNPSLLSHTTLVAFHPSSHIAAPAADCAGSVPAVLAAGGAVPLPHQRARLRAAGQSHLGVRGGPQQQQQQWRRVHARRGAHPGAAGGTDAPAGHDVEPGVCVCVWGRGVPGCSGLPRLLVQAALGQGSVGLRACLGCDTPKQWRALVCLCR